MSYHPDSYDDVPRRASDGTLLPIAEAKKPLVLAAARSHLSLAAAARAAGVERHSVLAWRKADPEFDAALRECQMEAVEVLEESAYERALRGDTLLTMFVIKGHKPEYNDRVQAARALAEAFRDDPARLALAEFGEALREIRGERGFRPLPILEVVGSEPKPL